MSARATSRLQTNTKHLNFGPWSAELRGDELLHIRHNGLPVLRGIRAVVRNHNWLTLTPHLMASHSHQTADTLKTVLDVGWKGYAARYSGRVTLLFRPDSLEVSFHGSAVEDLGSNRIGLVVLHRPDDAGRAIVVTSPTGHRTNAAFPTSISPHQPFKDVAALEWEREQVAYRLDFEGDIFETEDQRNWTDASFKTYSTPLSKPFPVTHHTGDSVRQRIRLSARQIIRVLDEPAGVVPALGTSAGTSASQAPASVGSLPAHFGALLAEVALHADPALGLITAPEATALAKNLNISMDARIIADTPEDAVTVLRALPLDRTARLGIYGRTSHITEDSLWDAVTAEAKDLGYRGELLAGARSHFTELNRNQHSARQDADSVTYSITPQMHATEPAAIIETLRMQTLTTEGALLISNGRPLHIGPVTLAPRFNAVATQPPLTEELPAADALQKTPFAAAWLLGSVSALTGPGAASITYGTLSELGSPAGELLLQLSEHSGSAVLATDTEPQTVAIFPVRTPEGILAYIANLTAEKVAASVISPSGTPTDLSLAPWQTTTILLP